MIIAHRYFIDCRNERNDTETQESDVDTHSHPKRTRGRPRKVLRGHRKINAASSQRRPTSHEQSYPRVIVHGNPKKKIHIVSPDHLSVDASSGSIESDVLEHTMNDPKVWLKHAAAHMKSAAIGGNLVMTQQVSALCLVIILLHSSL